MDDRDRFEYEQRMMEEDPEYINWLIDRAREMDEEQYNESYEYYFTGSISTPEKCLPDKTTL
jgi:hypothetical protein